MEIFITKYVNKVKPIWILICTVVVEFESCVCAEKLGDEIKSLHTLSIKYIDYNLKNIQSSFLLHVLSISLSDYNQSNFKWHQKLDCLKASPCATPQIGFIYVYTVYIFIYNIH